MLFMLGHESPSLLQIFREALKPGAEAAYDAVERDIARQCETLLGPHAYLGCESLTGPKQVWFFNGFRSREEYDLVAEAYARNTTLMAALVESARRKAAYTHSGHEVFVTRAAESSADDRWGLGRGHFAVMAIGRAPHATDGVRFNATDGTSYFLWSTASREEAERIAQAAGTAAQMLALRPEWSLPEPSWAAADPTFWSR
jgi:hypothetical protein